MHHLGRHFGEMQGCIRLQYRYSCCTILTISLQLEYYTPTSVVEYSLESKGFFRITHCSIGKSHEPVLTIWCNASHPVTFVQASAGLFFVAMSPTSDIS